MINSPTQGVIEFSEWCQILLPKHVVHVTDPVFVRYLFERHISSVIGVDVDEPPANLRPKDTFYSIPSLLLNYYQLEIPKGIYVYRYSDRQLLDAGEDYTELMDTNITDITKLFDIKKPFFAGYKLAFDKPDQHTLELSILDQLSTEHLDNFYVSPVYGDEGSAFVSFGRFSKLEAPFFFVVSTDINEGQSKRWAVIDEEHIHNVTYLSELLTRIEKDEEPSIIISERIDETNPLQLTYKTYNEKISNNEKGSIVYFYSKDVLEAQQQLIIMKYTAKALENNNIKIYTYDANKNDLPEIFVDEIELPIVAYVEKDKDEIVFYDGGYSLEELAHWAVEVCGGDASKLELKKYSDELDKELMDMQNTEQNMDESL
ncbi:Thioredoxin family protein [Histomonas meleagridis]|uniref:Thioredoxin family protein n=1 Tax=Histomonas meleagridis TaxID=135588 RepID=UPI00355AA34A|nr:Thioredoxin family protein [Histomonas meleagridis]KAH0800968.1 Thioredoxin family protein [Histomonas meleagridis]